MEQPKYLSKEKAEDIASKMKKEVEENRAENYEEAVENIAILEISGIAQRNKEMPRKITANKILKSLEETEDLEDLVEKENKAVFFLRGMLNLENFYLEQKNADGSKPSIYDYDINKPTFKKAFEDFSKIVEEGEEFVIKVKNKKKLDDGTYEDVDVTYGDLSLANAYLADFYMMKYYTADSKNEDDWQKADELYKKAIDLENVGGLKHEAKTTMVLRRLAHYMGKEDLFYVLKTVRRVDLQNPAADIIIQYVSPGDSKEVESVLIDITLREKDKKNEEVHVVLISAEDIDYLADLDFKQPPFVKIEDAGSLRKDNTKYISSKCLDLAQKFSDALDVKEKDKNIFMANLFINKSKYQKYFPAMSGKIINMYRDTVENGIAIKKPFSYNR